MSWNLSSDKLSDAKCRQLPPVFIQTLISESEVEIPSGSLSAFAETRLIWEGGKERKESRRTDESVSQTQNSQQI